MARKERGGYWNPSERANDDANGATQPTKIRHTLRESVYHSKNANPLTLYLQSIAQHAAVPYELDGLLALETGIIWMRLI